jgi:hypothetical protein
MSGVFFKKKSEEAMSGVWTLARRVGRGGVYLYEMGNLGGPWGLWGADPPFNIAIEVSAAFYSKQAELTTDAFFPVRVSGSLMVLAWHHVQSDNARRVRFNTNKSFMDAARTHTTAPWYW